MRIMALDVGTKRIGVAITDPLGMLAQPLTVVQRKSDEAAIEEILKLIAEKGVGEVVVGLPRRTDGSEGPEAAAVRQFAAKLQERCNAPLAWYDERLTTALAQNVLLEADLSRAKRKKVVDQVAASVILQGYLEYRGTGLGKNTRIKNEE
ncbi:MAG: Holliday junction resolvase RuvX [Firmicutes bacterium]|nr:Holliday junction resolvase RuvX [Bacillota bacterium]